MTHTAPDDDTLVHTAAATADERGVRTDDGTLEVPLAVAGEGSDGSTTPEHLMAAALAGCANPIYRTDVFKAQLTAPYTLASGDRIRVIVFGQDALSNSYAINGSGMISMPLIGDVPVKGLPPEDAAREIGERLRKRMGLLAQAIEAQPGARLPGARRLATRARAMRDGIVISPDIEAAARC